MVCALALLLLVTIAEVAMGAMMPVKFLKQPLHGSGGIWGADGAEDGEPKGDGGSRARSAEAASAAADTCFAAAVCAAF